MKIRTPPHIPLHTDAAKKEKKPTRAYGPDLPPVSVTAEISEEAREKALTSNGKNAASPAHRARECMAEYENLGHVRFGQVVSSLARNEEPQVPGEPVEAPADVVVPVASGGTDDVGTDTATAEQTEQLEAAASGEGSPGA